jgi:hypothetical protein
MRAQGYECAEIVATAGRDPVREIAALDRARRRVVLVSCAHHLHDAVAMLDWVGVPGALSLPELLARLRPDAKVFVPHDLGTPLLGDEVGYLQRFDLYLGALASERAWRRYVDVEIVGWAKHLDATAGDNAPAGAPAGRALWLFSDAETMCRADGAQRVFERLRPMVRPWCAMKFAPVQVTAGLERLLAGIGIAVVDASTPPPEAAAHFRIVVSNGDSSAVREAALLGKPVFILTDSEVFPTRIRDRIWQFCDMRNVRFVPDLDAIPEHATGCAPRFRAFDFERAIAAITRLAERGRSATAPR